MILEYNIGKLKCKIVIFNKVYLFFERNGFEEKDLTNLKYYL